VVQVIVAVVDPGVPDETLEIVGAGAPVVKALVPDVVVPPASTDVTVYVYGVPALKPLRPTL